MIRLVRGIRDGGHDILPFQVGVVLKNFLGSGTCAQELENI